MEAHFQCADPEDPGKNQCYNGKSQIQAQVPQAHYESPEQHYPT